VIWLHKRHHLKHGRSLFGILPVDVTLEETKEER